MATTSTGVKDLYTAKIAGKGATMKKYGKPKPKPRPRPKRRGY